jgi:hypothetical protein
VCRDTDSVCKGYPLVYASSVGILGCIPRDIMVPYQDFIEGTELLGPLGLLGYPILFIVLIVFLAYIWSTRWDDIFRYSEDRSWLM